MVSLNDSLTTHFGFSSFRPGQEQALQSLISGRDTLAVMPTGAGKSLIYQLAALILQEKNVDGGITLVISPLIALMKDQVDGLNQRGIPATYINSSMDYREQAQRLEAICKGVYRLVYIAPERLRSARFLESLQKNHINLMTVDEAHCISEWGHDFRPDYMNIKPVRETLDLPLTVALTATATPKVQSDIVKNLGMPENTTRVVTGFNRPNLFLDVRYAKGTAGKLRLLLENLSTPARGAVIIYTGTRRDAEEAADFIQEVTHQPAECYHAGLAIETRTRIQDDFIKGRLDVIVATNAFGMGIDRADVRQVIHFSMPGTLENYYQEAGRAGRDGQPARATLLYDPQDRALQEFFIEQSKYTVEMLKSVYKALPDSDRLWIANSDLSLRTGLHETQVRICLSALEQAGALQHLGDEGLRMSFKRGVWNTQEIGEVVHHNQLHNQNRRLMLNHIIHYAQSNDCRRRIILQYFGDQDTSLIHDCCDICRDVSTAKKPAQERNNQAGGMPDSVDLDNLSYGERAALIILDCIGRSRIAIGQGKLTRILHGSKARDILSLHYDKNSYYGKLAAVQVQEIEQLINQLIEQGYLKVTGGKYPVLSLTVSGKNALAVKEQIPLKFAKSFNAVNIQRNKEKLEAGGTVEYTEKLFEQGLTPEQIARERGLTLTTVYGHFAKLISAGKVAVEQVVPQDKRLMVENAIRQAGTTQQLQLIYDALPQYVDKNLIRCVIEGIKWKQGKQAADPPDVQNTHPVKTEEDAVEFFLKKAHPRPLSGPWESGWALSFHSSFSGSEWGRSEVGELTYRLKYEGDTSVLKVLVEQTAGLVEMHPELIHVDFIIPVPSTIQRQLQPVNLFCAELGKKYGLQVRSVVSKVRENKPQKEMTTRAQKLANVKGAFRADAEVQGRRVLVVDDLYDSGATLQEIAGVIKQAGGLLVNVLTLTRTIHSDT